MTMTETKPIKKTKDTSSAERGREEKNYDPRQLKIDPELRARWQPHQNAIDDKYNSIRRDGQYTAVECRRVGNEVYVTDGATRVLAMRRMADEDTKDNKAIIKTRCVFVSVAGEQEAFERAIQTNRQINQVDDIDDGHNILVLNNKYNKTLENIADFYNKPLLWVNEHITLMSLEQKWLNLLRNGEIRYKVALTLANLQPNERDNAYNNADRTVSTNKVTSTALSEAAGKGRKPSDPASLRANTHTVSAFTKGLQEEFDSEQDGLLRDTYGLLVGYFKKHSEVELKDIIKQLKKIDLMIYEGHGNKNVYVPKYKKSKTGDGKEPK